MSTRVIAACDGACKGNPGPAAWGWVIADADGQIVRWASGPLGEATNNIAELTALERLLAATDPDDDLECRMDSTYAMNAVTAWLPKWKKNGWQTTAKKPVANKELVVRIDSLLAGRNVKFVHVAAHQTDGDPLNAIADRAASAAAASQQAASGTSLDNLPEAPDEAPRTWSSSKKQTTGPAGVISARYPGTCRCGKPYKAGEKISKGSHGGWGHPACAADGAAAE